MAEEKFSISRAVWTALLPQRPTTLDDLQVITGCEPGSIAVYLNVLLRHQYLSLRAVRRAASGEAICVFVLTRATGPAAPEGNADDTFHDPNLAKPGRARRPSKPLGPLPSIQGRIRYAAEQIGRPFKQPEIIAAINEGGTDFYSGWNRLVWAKELVKLGPERHDLAWWELRLRPDLRVVRDWCLAHPGKLVDSATLRAHGIEIGNGPITRMAMDLLAAEGYRVEVERRDKNAKRYRVLAKEGAE